MGTAAGVPSARQQQCTFVDQGSNRSTVGIAGRKGEGSKAIHSQCCKSTTVTEASVQYLLQAPPSSSQARGFRLEAASGIVCLVHQAWLAVSVVKTKLLCNSVVSA